MRGADRVGDLQLAPVGEARGHDVLRDVPRHVGSGPVDLRRVLARERAAAVRRHPAVGVDDDLAPGEAGIGLRPADLEAARRVDEYPDALGRSSGNSRRTGSITSASMSGRRRVSTSTSSRCCAEISTVSTRTGLPSTYSTDTWLLPSGRRYGTTPALRTSESRFDKRWAIAIGIGISSSVSRQA